MTATVQPELLRKLNERRVIETIQFHGPSTRADMTRIAGISAPTVSKAVACVIGIVIDARQCWIGSASLDGRIDTQRSCEFATPATYRGRGLGVALLIVTLAMSVATISTAGSDLWAAEGGPSFESKIAPLLIRRCVECHNEAKASGDLVLSTHAGLLAGGESGPVVMAGKPAESYLLERVIDGDMPPQARGKPSRFPRRKSNCSAGGLPPA